MKGITAITRTAFNIYFRIISQREDSKRAPHCKCAMRHGTLASYLRTKKGRIKDDGDPHRQDALHVVTAKEDETGKRKERAKL